MSTLTQNTGPNIHQRINGVRKAIDYIKKDVEVQGYMAVTHDQVTAMVRKHLIETGIVVSVSLDGTPRVVDTGTKTAKGVPFIRFEAEFLVSFVNIDDPSDHHTIRIPAHAIDQGDKAPGKAVSYAAKTAILKMFNLETGEDDEGRNPDRESAGMPEKEEADWRAKIEELTEPEQRNELWKTLLSACEKHNDRQAAIRLKSALTARCSALKKRVSGAATAH